MDAATLIPTPDTIPVSWGWFQALLLLTFLLHILVMNIMLGTAFIALVSHLKNNRTSNSLTREIAKKLPFAIAFAVNFGVAPLLFAQVLYGHFLYTSSVLMATFWLSIIGLLMIAYYAAYVYKYKHDQLPSGRIFLIGLTVSLLLIIGFFFSNNMTLMLHPESWSRYLEQPGGLLLNLADPTLLPRYLHFMLSAIAIGGLSIAIFSSYKHSRGQQDAQLGIESGCKWFAYSTMVNIAVGFWFYFSLPKGMLAHSTPQGIFFIILLIAGLGLSILAIIRALSCRVLAVTHLTLTAVVLMVFMRDLVRRAYLKPWFTPQDLEVVPVYAPFILFLLSFIAGLALIGWMLKLAFEANANEEAQP